MVSPLWAPVSACRPGRIHIPEADCRTTKEEGILIQLFEIVVLIYNDKIKRLRNLALTCLEYRETAARCFPKPKSSRAGSACSGHLNPTESPTGSLRLL